jgi:hypothetical protein
MVVSTPAPTDNTPLIVGVVVGSLLFLALVALVVFFVHRRNSKAGASAATAMPARSGENMVRARNEYGQLPGVKAYGDVADVRATAANSYGNANVSPKAEYDAPDSPFTL